MPTVTRKRHLSQIAPLIVQSEIRFMSVECERLGGINLAQGICDTDLPLLVADAAVRAIRKGLNTYTRADGIAQLREAIAVKLASYNGIQANPETEIVVTSGATGALYATGLALLDPGDEVILFEPYYGYHGNTLLSIRAVPVPVPLHVPDWEIDVDRLREAITERTRAIMINTPSNPSGKVFTRAELKAIADLAIEHDLFVFTDEIYEYFLYDGRKHISIAALPGMAERTITISGLSKTFSITGWRIGYLAADAKWIPTIRYFHDLLYVCSPGPLQYGAVAGLVGLGVLFYREMAIEYQQKRDQLCAALADAGLTPSVPHGAYYVLADSRRIPGQTGSAKARHLLASIGVAAVSGAAFFASAGGEDQLRFCFGKSPESLDQACAAIRAF